MSGVGSMATTAASVSRASTVAAPMPAPRSTTRSPAFGPMALTTSELTGERHITGADSGSGWTRPCPGRVRGRDDPDGGARAPALARCGIYATAGDPNEAVSEAVRRLHDRPHERAAADMVASLWRPDAVESTLHQLDRRARRGPSAAQISSLSSSSRMTAGPLFATGCVASVLRRSRFSGVR